MSQASDVTMQDAEIPPMIVWGGTGNFKVLTELLKYSHRIVGFFDNNPGVVREYKGVPWLGTRDKLDEWIQSQPDVSCVAFLVSVGPGRGNDRIDIHEDLKKRGLRTSVAIHRTAFVAECASIGEGSQIYANAVVCVDARVGKCCIINTNASIDHECTLGDGVTIGPGATLAGEVRVGRNADIYSNATVLPRVRIGDGAIVGAGAVVLRDVPDGAVVVGNPARLLRMRDEDSLRGA